MIDARGEHNIEEDLQVWDAYLQLIALKEIKDLEQLLANHAELVRQYGP